MALRRSHAWVLRGKELVEPRPRNWGDNLMLVGAMPVDRWLTMSTAQGADASRLVRGQIVEHDDVAGGEAQAGAAPTRETEAWSSPPMGHHVNVNGSWRSPIFYPSYPRATSIQVESSLAAPSRWLPSSGSVSAR